MTNVITRYFERTEDAQKVRRELVNVRRFSLRIVHLYDNADGLAAALTDAHVDPKTAQAYQDRVAKGGAVLMVRAGHIPLGVAKITRKASAAGGAVDLGDLVEEVVVKDPPKPMLSVLADQPLMLTARKDPFTQNAYMANWPIPLIVRRTPTAGSVMSPVQSMTGWFFPLTDRRKPFTGSLIGKHARMAAFPLPLLSNRKPFTRSIFPRHARMARFPIPLISRRRPFARTIIGRHTRMANWPFPLLINGKTGTNALMPGGPRMAAFPISLISKRVPSHKSIFPRHARMANFPIPLTSRRKPFTGSAIPRHGRMADVILPLVIKQSDKEPAYGSKRFSLSKMLGFPTLIRR